MISSEKSVVESLNNEYENMGIRRRAAQDSATHSQWWQPVPAAANWWYVQPITGTLAYMPTAYPRFQTSRTPQVEKIIEFGRQRWPNAAPGRILVALASERVAELQTVDAPQSRNGILLMPSSGRVLTSQMVLDAQDDD